MRYWCQIIITILCFTIGPLKAIPFSNEPNLLVSEHLRYSVSYLGIRIGTIEMENTFSSRDSSIISGLESKTEIVLRSFSGIPFLAIRTEFLSETDKNGVFTQTETFDRQRNSWAYYKASHDPDMGFILIERGYKDERNSSASYNVEIDTVFSDNLVHDALTFINLLRRGTHKEEPFEIDIIVDRNIEKLHIELPTEIDSITVLAFKNSLKAYRVAGVLNFESIHGLSRNFQAWIGADKHRIPLKARVNIAIGSIKINLQEYSVTYK